MVYSDCCSFVADLMSRPTHAIQPLLEDWLQGVFEDMKMLRRGVRLGATLIVYPVRERVSSATLYHSHNQKAHRRRIRSLPRAQGQLLAIIYSKHVCIAFGVGAIWSDIRVPS